jgi:hypothetical protein
LKVRDKDFDWDIWIILMDCCDGVGKLRRTPIGKVISGYRSDNYIPQTQSIDCLHNVVWLLGVHSPGLSILHRTEGAIASTNITQYHEGSCILGKAFCPVRTTGTFTNGM